MNEEALKRGFEELNQLSHDEYRASFTDIVRDSDNRRGAMRVGRLAGVILKQPFAVRKDLPVPSDRTQAFRAWNLVDATCFDEPARVSIWQHQAAEEIRRELSQGDPFWASKSVYQLAEKAHSEGGLFTFFAWISCYKDCDTLHNETNPGETNGKENREHPAKAGSGRAD